MCLCISKLCYSNVSNVYDPNISSINNIPEETKTNSEYEIINFKEQIDNLDDINNYDVIELDKEFENKIESNIIHNLKIISKLTLDDKLWINENGLFEKYQPQNWLLNYTYFQPINLIILVCNNTINQAIENPNRNTFMNLLELSLPGLNIMMSLYPSKVNDIQILINKIKQYFMKL